MARNLVATSSQYLSYAGAVLSGTPLALACWFYTSVTNQYQDLVGVFDAVDTGNDMFFIGVSNTTYLAAYAFAAGSGAGATCTAQYSASTWTHAVGIFASATDRRVLMNAGSKGTNATSKTPSGLGVTLIARDARASGSYLDGRIAEAAIWDLTNWPGATDADKADEFERVAVPALAVGYSPVFFSLGLAAYWPLIRDEDRDRVGGYHLTPYGSPTIAEHLGVFYPAPIFMPYKAAVAPGAIYGERGTMRGALRGAFRGI